MKWLFIIAGLLSISVLHADTVAARPEMKAAMIDAMPAWDTVFADPQWKQATAQDLIAPSNVTFPKPPESTQIRALWCRDYLLVRFDCHDQSIVHLPGTDANSGPRDQSYFKADAVEVFFDPVGDAHMYMEFQFAPNNGVFDAIYFCTTSPQSQPDLFMKPEVINRDLFTLPEWNLDGLKTTARVWPDAEGKGWSVIAAFPAGPILKRLGQTNFAAGMKFKINFVRFDYFADDPKKQDITNWSPVLAGCAHVSPSGMGTLELAPKP